MKWHGFQDWANFLKATISLGTMLTLGLWAILTYAFDDRYVQHKDLDAAVRSIEQKLDDSSRERDCKNLLARMEELEDAIEFKKQRGLDYGLESKHYTRAERSFEILNHCVRR